MNINFKIFSRIVILISIGFIGFNNEARAEVPTEFFGTNIQAIGAENSTVADRHLAAMEENNLSTVRLEVSWWHVEPQPPVLGEHTYNWSHFDRLVTKIAEHHLRPYILIDYSARWSGITPGDPFSAPQQELYVSFASAVASRYGRRGAFWSDHPELPHLPATHYEIWNEQNLSQFWRDQSDAPERYASLYLATRAALHNIDREAIVVTGGLSPGGAIDFVKRMKNARADLAGNIDAFGYHPYATSLGDIFNLIKSMRLTIDQQFGEGIPMDITEIGWPYAGYGSEAERAERLSQLALALPFSDCGISSLMPHTWVDMRGSTLDNSFGLFKIDGSGPELTGTAYFEAISKVKAGFDAPNPALSCKESSPIPFVPTPQSVPTPPSIPTPPSVPKTKLAVSTYASAKSSFISFKSKFDLPAKGRVIKTVYSPSGLSKSCQITKKFNLGGRHSLVCRSSKHLRKILRKRSLRLRVTIKFISTKKKVIQSSKIISIKKQ